MTTVDCVVAAVTAGHATPADVEAAIGLGVARGLH
jgi:hypothetical protein